MTPRDVQDYLEKGMYGTPQINPDEQRKYLGTFRERVFLSMTLTEIAQPKNLTHLKTELTTNPGAQLLINAAVPFSVQNDYMKVAQETNCAFKIVDTDNQSQPEAIALVYAAEAAVDIELISVTEKYGEVDTKQKPTTSNKKNNSAEEETTKKGFFKNLFK